MSNPAAVQSLSVLNISLFRNCNLELSLQIFMRLTLCLWWFELQKPFQVKWTFDLLLKPRAACGSTAVRWHGHLLFFADRASLEDVHSSMCVRQSVIASVPLHFSFLCWCKLRVHISQWAAVSGWYWIMSEWSVMSTCRKCGLSSCQDI